MRNTHGAKKQPNYAGINYCSRSIMLEIMPAKYICTPNRRTLSLLSNSVHTQQKNVPKNVSIVEFVVVVMLI